MRTLKLAFSLTSSQLDLSPERIEAGGPSRDSRKSAWPSEFLPAFVSPSPNPWRKPFLKLVCEHYHSPPRDYAKTVLTRSLKPGLRWLARMLYCLCPSWFAIDLITLNNLVKVSNDREFQRTLREYEELCHLYQRSFRFRLGLRLSCRELIALKNTLLTEAD
jgi:hypothetical protein